MSGMLDFWVIWQVNVYLYKSKKVSKDYFSKFLYHFILITEIYKFSSCFIFVSGISVVLFSIPYVISTLHEMFAFGLLKFKKWKEMNGE